MQHDTTRPRTVVALIKICSKENDLDRGSKIHADVARTGLVGQNSYVASALISMYAKCGALAKAQEVFERLLVRPVVVWNALIAGLTEHGCGKQALDCFEQMFIECVSPNTVTYLCILKACGSTLAEGKGQQVHAEIVGCGLLGKDAVIGSVLVDMYAKCGLLAKAQEVCGDLPIRDVVTWSSLITGYSKQGHAEEALKCFEQMQLEGVSPNAVTFTCILKACASIGAADKGQKIHAEIIKEDILANDVVAGTALVDMYAKCGLLANAQEVCDKLPARDVVTWSALIAGYAQQELGEQALECFELMQHEGCLPNAITFTYILKACSITGAADKGQEIHARIVREGLLEKDIVLGNALVDMYAKSGLLAEAQKVCRKLPVRDVVTWSALIAGYVQHGHAEQAVNCFESMQLEGLSPDAITFACILKACGSIGYADKGQEIYAEIVREELLDKDLRVDTALLDMFTKCGLLARAQEVFDKLQVRDVVVWSALLSGYAECGLGEQALKCFERMQLEGISPDAVTLASILKACGSLVATEKGQEVHAEIVRQGLLEKDHVGIALVDMYGKCGQLAEAQCVFDKLPVQDIVSWNALITGYALHSEIEHVFCSFDKMIAGDIKPDYITFNILLNACCHAGLPDEGQRYFESMGTEYDITPTLEQYTCMIDLFARAGHLHKAVALIEEMPFPANLIVWHIVLTACHLWGNVELGRLAFQNLVRLEQKELAGC